MDVAFLALFAVAAVASLFMSWVIGAGSSGATPFAPAVGANAIPTMRAAFVVGLFGFAGAVTQGANVSEAVGSGLVGGVSLPAGGVILALAIGAGLMAVGIRTGYPIATAFTVTGAVIGIGLALGGTPVWPKYRQIGAVWVLTPFVGGGIAYVVASLLPRPGVPERFSIAALAGLVGSVLANVEFASLGHDGSAGSVVELGLGLLRVEGLSLWSESPSSSPEALRCSSTGTSAATRRAGSGACCSRWGRWSRSPRAGARSASLSGRCSRCSTTSAWPQRSPSSLAGGGYPRRLLDGCAADDQVPRTGLLLAGAAAFHRRARPSFLIAQTAVLLGVPVSFNEIVVSAIVGSGAAVGGRRLSAPASCS